MCVTCEVDDHVRAAASISTFFKNRHKTTTLWRTGALFGLEFFWPLYLIKPSVLLPVAVGILTGAIGSHALRPAGLSQDRVEAFITAAHYAVNTCYRYQPATDDLSRSRTRFSMVLGCESSLYTHVSALIASRVLPLLWGALSSQLPSWSLSSVGVGEYSGRVRKIRDH